MTTPINETMLRFKKFTNILSNYYIINLSIRAFKFIMRIESSIAVIKHMILPAGSLLEGRK